MKKYFFLFLSFFVSNLVQAKEPIVTAEKLLEYKRVSGHLEDFKAPKVVLVCYQRSTLEYLLEKYPDFKPTKAVTHFYISENGKVGILGDWGVGAPGLAIKMEELVVLGANCFVAVGTAGSLMDSHAIADFVFCPDALAEDGVAHLYLPEDQIAIEADQKMLSNWAHFAKEHALPEFQPAKAWSFSAIFKETVEDVLRVNQLGCSVVEMEAATLYAIGKEKNVQTLSLFVISDSLSEKKWTPKVKDPKVYQNLHQLADWALEFCIQHVPQ